MRHAYQAVARARSHVGAALGQWRSASTMTGPEEEAWKKLLGMMSTGQRLVEHQKRRGQTVDTVRAHMLALGLDPGALPPVVHIAGTKGKGSTGAMVESCLRSAGMKTLLYTSPHLVSVRERFRVNCAPADVDTYLRSFWPVYNGVFAEDGSVRGDLARPNFFMLLTLIAFRMAAAEGIDALVLEVGVGGRTDATNAVTAPSVAATGVTTLDWDHTDVLGSTLPEIAAHKAGIFKAGVPAFTVPQRADAMASLVQVAASVGAPLATVDPEDLARRNSSAGGAFPRLALDGDFQRTNAAMAVALAETFMARREGMLAARARPGAAASTPVAAAQPASVLIASSPSELPAYAPQSALPEWVVKGLANAYWPGRAQALPLRKPEESSAASTASAASAAAPAAGTVYVDGAHTERSMRRAVDWFKARVAAAQASSGSGTQHRLVLVFNCPFEKDTLALLLPLTTVPFDGCFITGVQTAKPSLAQQPTVASVLNGFMARKQALGDVDAVACLEEGQRLAAASGSSAAAAASDGMGATSGADASASAAPSQPGLWQDTLKELLAAAHERAELLPLRRRLAAPIQEYALTGTAASGAPAAPSAAAAASTKLPAAAPPTFVDLSPFSVLAKVQAEAEAADAEAKAGKRGPGVASVHTHVLVTGSLYLVGAALEHFGASP